LGPAAVRIADLEGAMRSIGVEITRDEDIAGPECSAQLPGLKNFGPGLECVKNLRARVLQALNRAETPLVIGGDHFIAAGSVAAALEVHGDDLALLWIDAHADLNTPDGSPSGNLHGMPFAALLGLPSSTGHIEDRQWKELIGVLVPRNKLQQNRSAWLGLRELDLEEQETIANMEGRFAATMHDIDFLGIVECLNKFDHWLRASGAKKLWISFDVDVLDPQLAPGTGTAVRGGLTYREMHVFGEVLHQKLSMPNCPYSLVGLDLVEINPLHDTGNITALTAVEWVASLFGKRILGPLK
jgi:arginase